MVDGRRASLDMLSTMLTKLPAAEINDRAELLFLPLVARLVNEDDASLRKVVAIVVKSLFTVVSDDRADRIFTLTLGWLEQNDAKPRVRMVALQLLSIFAEASGAPFFKRYTSALPQVLATLQSAVDRLAAAGSASNEAPSDWELPYFALASLEKVLTASPASATSPALAEVWPAVSALIAYPHSWVQYTCVRLIGMLFARSDAKAVASRIKGGQTSDAEGPAVGFLASAEDLFSAAKLLLDHITGGRQTPKSLEQTLRDLVFIGRVLCLCPEVVPAGLQTQAKRHAPLLFIFQRLAKVVKSGDNAQKQVALKWFAAMVTVIPAEEPLGPFLEVIVRPLFRATTAKSGDRAQERTLAREVVKLVKERAGEEAYHAALGRVRRDVTMSAEERKRLAVSDPKKHAQAKLQASVKPFAVSKRMKIARRMLRDGTSIRVPRAKRDAFKFS